MLDLLYTEIDKIQDPDIRGYTRLIVDSAPVDSWKLPSSRDHHLRDECGEWGNLIHTVRVTRICSTLSDILDLGPRDRDILRSAAVLHDSCKHGVDAEALFIYKEHPWLVKRLVEGIGIEVDPIINTCIEQHMGRWGPEPVTFATGYAESLPFLLHVADCIEARLPEMRVPKVNK